MDVKELFIEEHGEICFPDFYDVRDGFKSIGYRFSNCCRIFPYEWKFIYDGVVFIGGPLGMTEVTTGFNGVMSSEIKGKITFEKCLEIFKRKLRDSGKTIHEVVQDCKNRNLDLETWLINSLII